MVIDGLESGVCKIPVWLNRGSKCDSGSDYFGRNTGKGLSGVPFHHSFMLSFLVT